MPQAVCHRPIIADAWFRCQGIPYGICGEKSGTGIGVSLLLQLSPVSIIAPVLRIPVSFTCPRRYIILAFDNVIK
jgi:hypothetical protein